MLKQLLKGSLFALCLFSSMSAFAWHCTSTNARQSGWWVANTPHDGPYALTNAQQLALSFCRSAPETLNPGTCHIVTCVPNPVYY